MRELSPGYSLEVDTVDEETWYGLLRQFEDANIYQTWAYGLVRNGRQNISHVVLKAGSSVVAIAQCRIAKAPFIGAGIAYVMWGPLWRPHEACAEPEVFRQAIRALRNEYVCKRGLLLRLNPVLFEDDSLLHDGLRGDAGVVGAGHPQGVVPLHPPPPDEHVLQRVVERVPHV